MKIESSIDQVWLVRDHVGKIVSATGAVGIRCPDVSNLPGIAQKVLHLDSRFCGLGFPCQCHAQCKSNLVLIICDKNLI